MLSHPDVEVGGPHGTGRGTKLLQEWADRANIRLTPIRVVHRDDTVVVQQEAEWRSAETGVVTVRQIVASIFIVRDGRVASVVRYDDLTNALQKANLDESNGQHRPSFQRLGDRLVLAQLPRRYPLSAIRE
jgi:hypothetical protein